MLFKVLLGTSIIGIVGFILKAREISKIKPRSAKKYITMDAFFACAAISMIGLCLL